MTTQERNDEQRENELRALRAGAEALAEVHERIAPRFRRAEVRSPARRFLEGLLAPVERKNGWQLAEGFGEHGPRGGQRLLGGAGLDEKARRGRPPGHVIQHLADEDGML